MKSSNQFTAAASAVANGDVRICDYCGAMNHEANQNPAN